MREKEVLHMNLIQLITCLADPFIWIKSMSVLGIKYEKKKSLYAAAFCGYLAILYCKHVGLHYLNIPCFSSVIDVLLPLYIISATLLLFKDQLGKRILSVGLFYSAMFISDALCFLIGVTILRTPVDTILSSGTVGSFWTIISKVVFSSICWLFFWRKSHSFINSLYGQKKVILVLLNIVYEIPLCTLIQNKTLQNNPSIILTFCISQIILITSTCYFLHVFKLQKTELYTLKCELEVIRQNTSAYKGLRQLKHDIAGHVNILIDLCKRRKYDMLEEYMEGMYGSIKQADITFDLPDAALSLLMGQLKQKSLDSNCRLRCFNSLSSYYMTSYDICSIVSNMLNNAIESACKLPPEDRIVSIEFLYIDGGYHIEVVNNAPLGTRKEDFSVTSKDDKKNHGIGMSIIHKIARKYEGCVVTSIITGEEIKSNYDIVTITVKMFFDEIEEIQSNHSKELSNFKTS